MDRDINLAITKILIWELEAELHSIYKKEAELTKEDKKAIYEYEQAIELVRLLEEKYESSKPIKGKNKSKKQYS